MNKESLIEAGYFYHKGGDFYGEKDLYRNRGIWFKHNSYKEEYIGKTWEEAKLDYSKNKVFRKLKSD
ncbi:MAG TPA: hypothetical protein QF753_14450 [Victivallales bacterium]|nr:hypothetical protein [Victivallales bacterium]